MNILFIFTDQQQRDTLGCMGNPNVRTPNLDRLAAEGVLFRRAYSNNPICGPFRIALLTGLYNSTTDTHNNGDRIPSGVRTLARSLGEGGYRTGFVGKWHIGGAGNGPIAPELRGDFHEFIGYQCYNGFYENVCFYDEQGVEHSFDKHRTEATTDLAIDRLRRMAGGPSGASPSEPFAMFVAYQAPHYPVQPSSEFADMYENTAVQRRPNARDVDPYTPTHSPQSPSPAGNDPDFRRYGNDLDAYIRLYNAMVTQIDANIQRLLDELDRLGLSDDTVVFFTSDHGDMQGSHGLKNKCLPYEESAGIPFIVRHPAFSSGQVVDVPVSSLDVYPTILELAGLTPEQGLSGRSIAGLLRESADAGSPAQRPIFSERPEWCMVCRDGWKLVADRKDAGLERTMLFNLNDDPYEMTNLLDDPKHSIVSDELFDILRRWDEQVRTFPADRSVSGKPAATI